jgi:hypothetical protein
MDKYFESEGIQGKKKKGLEWMAPENDPIWKKVDTANQEYKRVLTKFCTLAERKQLNYPSIVEFVRARQKFEKVWAEAFFGGISTEDRAEQNRLIDEGFGPEDALWDGALRGMETDQLENTISVLELEAAVRRKQIGEYFVRVALYKESEEQVREDTLVNTLTEVVGLAQACSMAVNTLRQVDKVR